MRLFSKWREQYMQRPSSGGGLGLLKGGEGGCCSWARESGQCGWCETRLDRWLEARSRRDLEAVAASLGSL